MFTKKKDGEDPSATTVRQHRNYLHCTDIRDFTLAHVTDMSETDCFWHFVVARFGSRDNFACPHCGVIDAHYFRTARRQWRCKHCDVSFSATSGTAFQDRKLPFKKMLMAIMIFISGAKGIASMHLSRQLNVQVKTAFVLAGKLREALARSADQTPLRETVEADGGYFGGRPRKSRNKHKPTPEQIEKRIRAKIAFENGTGPRPRPSMSKGNVERRKKRRVVFVLRQHSGLKGHGAVRTTIAVLKAESEDQVTPVIEENVVKGALIMTDENAAYVRLNANYEHEVVNHSQTFSTPDGVNENQAEAFFSRLRRYYLGISHKCEPKYLADIAWEMAWREDVRRKSEGTKLEHLLKTTWANGLSMKWRGYWQKRKPQASPSSSSSPSSSPSASAAADS